MDDKEIHLNPDAEKEFTNGKGEDDETKED